MECYELCITNPTHIRNCFYLGQITRDHLMLCYIKVLAVNYRTNVHSQYCTQLLLTELRFNFGDKRYSVLRKMVIPFFMAVTKILPVLKTGILPTSLTIKIGTHFPLINLTALKWNFYNDMEVPNHQKFSGSNMRKYRIYSISLQN